MQHSVASEGFCVVLDPHGCGFGCSEGLDAEQVGQGPVVNGEGLGDLEESDELESVKSLGARFVAVNLREPRVVGWVGNNEPVDVHEAEEASDRVHHRDD